MSGADLVTLALPDEDGRRLALEYAAGEGQLTPAAWWYPAGKSLSGQVLATGEPVTVEAGGKVTKTENWGVRSLTYRMNKNRKAHFVLMNIDASSAAVSEIERQERISEDVIRYLTVRVEEHEEGPSAMMRKADRDRDRDDRGGGFRGDREGGFRGDRDGGGYRGDRGPRRPRDDDAAAIEE